MNEAVRLTLAHDAGFGTKKADNPLLRVARGEAIAPPQNKKADRELRAICFTVVSGRQELNVELLKKDLISMTVV